MNKLLFAFVTVLLASTYPGASAQAQAARTWVSSNGTGVTCSRANPCATFSAAQTATASGGTIHCVDAGDYYLMGTFTITKSLTIDCAGTTGIHGIGNIQVSGANIVVHLRNLLIDGGGPTNLGVGVEFINGAALYVEHCTISGWTGSAIKFTPATGVAAKLIVLDSTIVDSGLGVSFGAGIFIQTAGTASVRVSIERTKIVGNNYGFWADGSNGTAPGFISAVIKDSYIANSGSNGVSLFGASGQAQVSVTMDHSASVGNGVSGIQANGSITFAVLTESTVIANLAIGLQSQNGGHIVSYKNNALIGNVTEGAPTQFFNLN